MFLGKICIDHAVAKLQNQTNMEPVTTKLSEHTQPVSMWSVGKNGYFWMLKFTKKIVSVKVTFV